MWGFRVASALVFFACVASSLALDLRPRAALNKFEQWLDGAGGKCNGV